MFVHSGLAAILKKVDEDPPGIEPILHREQLVKIHLGGVAGHTHGTQKSLQNLLPMDPYKP